MELTKIFVNNCRNIGALRDFLCQAIDQVDEKDREIAELKEKHKTEVKELLCLIRDKENNFNRAFDNEEKEINLQKCNRCLLRSVIAEMNATHFKDLFYDAGSEALADEYNKQITIHYKWHKRWLELAKKFKPNSTDK